MKGIREFFLTLPSFGWLVLFFFIPMCIIFANASLSISPEYASVFWRTLWLSGITTIVCISLSLPLGYFLARASARVQKLFSTVSDHALLE